MQDKDRLLHMVR